jgi:integrating conjugative element protein (TIGR03759 family)
MTWGTVPPVLFLAALGIPQVTATADAAFSQWLPSAQSAVAVAGHDDAGTQARFSRGQWGLDETEWQRYQALMAGLRGSLSQPSISPLEVLGIHARDEAERKKYARQFAEAMRQDTERVLAFQREYQQAWAELNPSGLMVDPSRLPASSTGRNTAGFQTGDRLLLFVKTRDCQACDNLLATALAGQRAGAQLDIFVAGAASDDGIRSWARQHNIDPEDVRRKRTTLNHDSGQLAQVAGAGATPPALAVIRNNQLSLLSSTGATR